MKSVSSGPVTNHFSPLRTYSPVAASRTAVAREGPGVGAGAVLGDRVAARALAAQARLEVARALLRRRQWTQRVVGARDVRPQAAGRLAELLVDEDLLERRSSPGRRPPAASEPPWSRASMRGRAGSGRPSRAATRPPARSNSTSRGWRTSLRQCHLTSSAQPWAVATRLLSRPIRPRFCTHQSRTSAGRYSQGLCSLRHRSKAGRPLGIEAEASRFDKGKSRAPDSNAAPRAAAIGTRDARE